MKYSMDCKAEIAAQSTSYPTYKIIDCDLQTNANDDFHGSLIDSDLAVVTTLVDACKNWNQGIRTTVTIDGVDVTSALVGDIVISRRKNQISNFSLRLDNTTYSPLTNSNIFPSKEVIIISYINNHEATLFTGLIDNTRTNWSGKFNIAIYGSGYGKKLRDTQKTLISVQNSAASKYRGDMVKYIVQQGGISSSNIDTIKGSYTRIDHSFENQAILDMVNKELVIDSMQWEFDENKNFRTFYDEIKSSTITYPTADWTYGEDRFFYLTLGTSDNNLLNDVKILGTVYETAIEITSTGSASDSPFNQYTDYNEGTYDNSLYTVSKSLTLAESILAWSVTGADFNIKVNDGIRNVDGVFRQPTFWGGGDQYYYYSIDVTFDGDYSIESYTCECSDGISFHSKSYATGGLFRFVVKRYLDGSMQGLAGTIKIQINGKSLLNQPAPDPEVVQPPSAVIDNEEVDTPTYEYEYNQVAAHVTDSYSIGRYGRREPKGTLEFLLAENINQCKGIGRKIIKDSHKYTKQPSFEVPFNPLLKVGQTIEITDSKIGYSQRWYVEEVIHTISQGKGRTKVGCVYYA